MSNCSGDDLEVFKKDAELHETALRLTKEWENAKDAAKNEGELMNTLQLSENMIRAWDEYTKFTYEHAKALIAQKKNTF